jgi:hypothetical protein
LPGGDCPLVEVKCMNNRLPWAPIRKKGYHSLDRLLIGTQPLEHRAFSLTKRFSIGMTPVPWSFATVNADIADSNLPSCTTPLVPLKEPGERDKNTLLWVK